MSDRLIDAVRWFEAPGLGPSVAGCGVVSLPAPRHDSPRRRARDAETWLPQRLLLARYCDGAVAYGALLGRETFDSYAIGAVCIALRDRLPGTRVRTELGTLIVGPEERALTEFEGTWRDRYPALPLHRPVRSTIRAFEAGLEGEVLARCPRGLPVRYRAYNWLRRQPAVDIVRFGQATDAYPFLWSLLLRLDDPSAGLLRERIRAAEPIAESLAGLLGAQSWQLRALQRAFVARHLDERDLDTIEDLLALVRALDHLVPERVPATREGWGYTLRAIDQLPHKAWLRGLGEAGLDALAAGKGVARFWRPFGRKSGLRRELSALADFCEHAGRFPEEAGLPVSHATDLRAVVEANARWRAVADPDVLAYYANRSCPPWLRHWVRAPWEPPAFDDEDLDDPQFASSAESRPVYRPLTGAWSPLLSDPVTVEGHVFVELATAEALREEGIRMRHCVARYARRCEWQGTHIFSVRTPSDERVSTLEVRRMGGVWSIAQHASKANATPGPEVEAAARQFVAGLAALQSVPRD
jgi:hypothetical protein